MKKNVICGIIEGVFLLFEGIIASSLSTEIDINEPSTYVELLKLPVFWITIFIMVLVQIIVAYNEKKKRRSDLNLKTRADRKQSIEITKTECINRLMKAATDKAIKEDYYGANQTMEVLKRLDSILDSEVKENGKNEKKNNS